MYMYRIIYLLIYSRNYILLCPFLKTIPCIIQRELLNKHLNIVPGQLFHMRDLDTNLTGHLQVWASYRIPVRVTSNALSPSVEAVIAGERVSAKKASAKSTTRNVSCTEVSYCRMLCREL
jgi:hypothetical protein